MVISVCKKISHQIVAKNDKLYYSIKKTLPLVVWLYAFNFSQSIVQGVHCAIVHCAATKSCSIIALVFPVTGVER